MNYFIITVLLLIVQNIYSQNNAVFSLAVLDKINQFEEELLHKVKIEGEQAGNMNLIQRMEFHKTPGLSIAIINDNTIEWYKSYGNKEQASDDKVNSGTLFQAASISKPITALTALHFVENESLSLDEPLNKFLNSWKIPENEFTQTQKPTLRYLLNHSAGFTNGSVGDYFESEPIPTLIQALNGEPPSKKPPVLVNYIPGTKWRYSGGGYTVLQQLFEDTQNRSFSNLLKEIIFQPLSMSQSYFQQPLSDSLIKFAATGHDEKGQVLKGRWTTIPEMAAGGLWTTARDLAKVIIEINKAYAGLSEKIVSQKMTKEILRLFNGAFGLGFRIEVKEHERSYSHTGSNKGYRAYFIGYPDKRQGAVILTNSDGGDDLRWEIMRSLAKIYGWSNFQQVGRKKTSVDINQLKDYMGKYQFEYSADWNVTIHIENDQFVASVNNGPLFQIYPESEIRFFSKENTILEFYKKDNKVDYITIQLDGDDPAKWHKISN